MIILITTITILFLLGILIRKKISNLCALCFAVAGTWILGLGYYFMGNNEMLVNKLSLGILMGGSAVGSMYYLSSKLPEKYSLFKLPYFLSFILFIYFIFEQMGLFALVGLGILWVLFLTLFIFRNDGRFKNIINQIIKCCKNW